MAKIQLLPRKSFEISLGEEVIHGQYGTWALSRFGEKQGGLSLDQLSKKLSNGSSVHDLMQLVLCSVEYSCRKAKKSFTYTDLDVAEWFDELGGLGSDELSKLWNHIAGTSEGETEEKKSLSDGENSSATQPAQE